MRVLVTAASRHGATAEIAAAIGDTLAAAGLEVVVRPPEEVPTVDPFDAVVLGSAVYVGHWLDAARDLVERDAAALAGRPVWLFSSGPVGDPPRPEGEPLDVAPILDRTGAVEHRVFAGRVDRDRLGFGEKTILTVVHAPEGDFRRWDEIGDWAGGIARSLRAQPVTAG